MSPFARKMTPLQLWLAGTCIVAFLSDNALVTAARFSRSKVERDVPLTRVEARAEHWNRLFGLYDINGDKKVSNLEFATLNLAIEALVAAKPSVATLLRSDKAWTSQHQEAVSVSKAEFIQGYSARLEDDGVSPSRDVELFAYLEHQCLNLALSYAPSHLSMALEMLSDIAEAPLTSEEVSCVQHWCERNCAPSSAEAPGSFDECCGDPLNIKHCLPYKAELLETVTGKDGIIRVIRDHGAVPLKNDTRSASVAIEPLRVVYILTFMFLCAI
eukprot:TRINITY_DN28494_c0_g2_i1.p1 TRINITY_DN28494_c0_g2~~TRINITY_DN28494_c0_g2_i1.p1  ORF type:complete len:272 (+),score=33.50 TRINITY_DN28494_c0_g2_i1:50-865(+)